jgi:DNA-binding MarR family transcriptional regulator
MEVIEKLEEFKFPQINRNTLWKNISRLIKKGYLTREGDIIATNKDLFKPSDNGIKNRTDFIKAPFLGVKELIVLDHINYWYELRKNPKIQTKNGHVWIDLNTLAKQVNTSYREVKRIIKTLKDNELISVLHVKKYRKLYFKTAPVSALTDNGRILHIPEVEDKIVHDSWTKSSPRRGQNRPPNNYYKELYYYILTNIIVYSFKRRIEKLLAKSVDFPSNYSNSAGVTPPSTPPYIFSNPLKKVSPPYSATPPHAIVALFGKEAIMDIDSIKEMIKQRHRSKSVKENIKSLEDTFRAHTNYAEALYPNEKNMLKKIYKWCKEVNLSFKDVVSYYGKYFDRIMVNCKEALSYLQNEDFSKPKVLYLIQTPVLQYVKDKLTITSKQMGLEITNVTKVVENNQITGLIVRANYKGKSIVICGNDLTDLPIPVKQEIKTQWIGIGKVGVTRRD